MILHRLKNHEGQNSGDEHAQNRSPDVPARLAADLPAMPSRSTASICAQHGRIATFNRGPEARCDGSLEYEVKAIAGRIQAPIGRAAMNIGEMTAVSTPTKISKMITVVIFTVT
jgi:hypothetical protein